MNLSPVLVAFSSEFRIWMAIWDSVYPICSELRKLWEEWVRDFQTSRHWRWTVSDRDIFCPNGSSLRWRSLLLCLAISSAHSGICRDVCIFIWPMVSKCALALNSSPCPDQELSKTQQILAAHAASTQGCPRWREGGAGPLHEDRHWHLMIFLSSGARDRTSQRTIEDVSREKTSLHK